MREGGGPPFPGWNCQTLIKLYEQCTEVRQRGSRTFIAY
jgi:hypothetical protein